ncbi:hypothetical protein L5M43_21610 [Shewanella sp. SW36]|uniref:hypothetical protein n=1 Tax=unclassified Shewanella TaxID=196818 RepID=UPI0021D91026|nr:MULTISPECIES: hypothetical protein [unclassified Shewanella]MCU7977809.1 hypothetical protein [Shewanella sp. SW36]MCU7993066.1 hypothetical protein [Shewanella sp. SW1]
MQIFTEALILVRSVEAHIVSEIDSDIHLFSYIKRLLWLPTKFLQMGINEKIKDASVWAFLSFIFMILGAWLINTLGIANTDAAIGILLLAMISPFFLVVFAMPSMYGDYGVSQQTIAFIVKHLGERSFSSVESIELLKKSVKPFEDRARSRVSALKWLVGILWACFTYTFLKGIEAPISNSSGVMAYVLMSAWLFVGIIVAYLCVWGYEASLDKLFRAIEFGCNDFCYFIELQHKINTTFSVNYSST